MSPALNHILCIDDDDSILEITRLCLETVGGYTVTACNRAQTGIDAAADTTPDVILIDVMMPDMDGLEALEKLRQNERTTDIPVIFMTARAQYDEIQIYKDAGAIGVIAKPFDPMTLSEEIAAMLNMAAENN